MDEGGGGERSRPVVLIDARMARRRRTGVARYVNGLLTALRAHSADVRVCVVHGPPALPRRNALTSIGNLVIDLAWTHAALPALALRHRADVLHAPFNWGPLWSHCPRVVTVHDLSWEVIPDAYPGGFRRFASLFTRRSARGAAVVIAVSRATADDLEGIYGIPGERIAVVHTGITMRPQGTGPREPVVLAVGEFEPRKRVPELVAAHRAYLAAAPAEPEPCRLVLAGAGGSDQERVRAMCGEGCTALGFVSDEELDRLYATATLLVSNSAFEGFGLPVAEAMSAGCPVLVADTPALREAGGPDALVMEGEGQAVVARALAAALADRAALAERGARGRAHAAGFSWAACAAGTVAAYRRAVA